MVTSLFSHIVHSEEKNCMCVEKIYNIDRRKKYIEEKKKVKKKEENTQ